MTDDGDLVILVLVEEFLCTRESDLVDVLLYLIRSHPDTSVADGDGLLLRVEADRYL